MSRNALIASAASLAVTDMLAPFRNRPTPKIEIIPPVQETEVVAENTDTDTVVLEKTYDDLEVKTKDELLDFAKQNNIKVAKSWTKAKIIDAIKAA